MSTILFKDFMTPTTLLVTNEYANWNPTDPKAVKSANWEMTSGSLFNKAGAGYSGMPDTIDPNYASSNGTNSAVFRLTTKRADYLNFATSFLLNVMNITITPDKNAWDGIHIFLRYVTEADLYYASVCRRDGHVVIKKKVSEQSLIAQGIPYDPAQLSNGGIYYPLTSEISKPFILGVDTRVKASAINNPDGSVTLSLYSKGVLLVQVKDNGTIGGKAITAPGKTGIRGDNAEFIFKEFVVEQL